MFDICPKAVIDLHAIQKNYQAVVNRIGSGVTPSAVVKSDAYGLGARKVSQALHKIGCNNFWTAYIQEAIDIRQVLPEDVNIFYLQGFAKSDIDLIKQHNLTPVINSIDDFNNIKGQNIEFVLHVDSGFSRLGLRPDDIETILPVIKNERIHYVISHLACSDEKDSEINLMQKLSFDSSLAKIREVVNVKAGISASGGVLLGEGYNYDMIRIGALLYGIKIVPDLKLRNVLSVYTKILQRYKVPSGSIVGYGATFKTQRETTLAVISIGYGDGIKRALSNKGCVIFYDDLRQMFKAPIVGRISMDLVTCDVTDISEDLTRVSSCATVIDENYSINEMAADANTIPYEILTSIKLTSKRFAVSYKD